MKIFCSGIGGIGLSSYAAHQRANGHDVCGSDCAASDTTRSLERMGVRVCLNQDGSAIPKNADLFVYSLAVADDHPERRRAADLHVPQWSYFQALGDLTKRHRLIAVCGTHGKSTTTAMAAKALIDGSFDPSVAIGTKTADLSNQNWRKGSGEYFLAEACEYRRSFLHLSPEIVLLTNITGDHFDVFNSMEDYRSAFFEFLEKIPTDGALITHNDDRTLMPFIEAVQSRGVTVINADGYEVPRLTVPGLHLQENARLVAALADLLDIPHVEQSLKQYSGCWRRSEVKGERRGVLVIDDYGHHPNEVRATLKGLKDAHPDRRLVCVFQPHTHSRTAKLYDDFLVSFTDADVVVVPNVFEARSDCDRGKVDAEKFALKIGEISEVPAYYGESIDKTVKLLRRNILRKNDLLVTMGAGDVWKIGDALLKRTPRFDVSSWISEGSAHGAPFDSAHGKHEPACTSPSAR
jgi:UDP-N-acetylmuramate--alanine ligase